MNNELNRIIRAAWKDLALADQADADVLLDLIKTLLENLEELEQKQNN